MNIDVTYDASVASAPAGFTTVVDDVVQFFESQFNNPITINIDVGWGEVDGFALQSGALGESLTFFEAAFSYAQTKSLLGAAAQTSNALSAVASLPASDPTAGGSFAMSTAEAKALGLSVPSTQVDGYVGFDSAPGTFDFNITSNSGGSVPPGEFDLFAVVAHEISEVMGRESGLGVGLGSSYYFPLDLFNYSAAGVRNMNSSAPTRYFSIDGGATNLNNFNTTPGGDLGDWASSAGADSFDAFSNPGVANLVTASDLALLNVLGYQPTPDFTASGLALAGASAAFQINDISQGAGGASTTGVYLSSTSTITTADTLLTTVAAPALTGGGMATASIGLALSPSLAPGTYYIGAIANYNGAVTESNTANDASNAAPIVIVDTSNASSISGVAGVDAFTSGNLTLTGPLTLNGDLTVTGSLTTSSQLGGTGLLALAGGTAAFNAGTVLTVARVVETGAATVATFGTTALTYSKLWTQGAGTVSVSAGDRVNFSGVGDSFAGTLSGAGTVAFIGGSDTLGGTTLSASSVIINGPSVTLSGAISIAHQLTATTANLVVAAAGATLSGGGRVVLTNLASNSLHGATSGAVLTNDDMIIGAGDVGGGQMTLINAASGRIIGNASTVLIIDTGANAVVNAGLIQASGAGGVTVKSAVNNTGNLAAVKGNLTVQGAVSGKGAVVINGGTADFASTLAGNAHFTGATGELELAQSQAYAGTVSGFSLTGGTSLDLVDIGFVSAGEATFKGTASGGVLTVTDGTHTASIHMAGDFLASAFVASSDGHGGTIVVDPPKSPPPYVISSAPVLQLVAAAASFGASFGIAASRSEAWTASMAALATPRAQMA